MQGITLLDLFWDGGCMHKIGDGSKIMSSNPRVF